MRKVRLPLFSVGWVLLALGAACGEDDSPPPPDPEPPQSPPETTITMRPPALTSSGRAEVSFRSPDEAPDRTIFFDCASDASPTFTSCVSPVVRTELSDGSYSLRVRARYVSGLVDATPAEASWTVDRTAPQTTITAGPEGDVAPVASMFSFSSNDPGATFECQVGTAAYAPCTSPLSVTVALGDGALAVRAVDLAGNADDSPATRGFRGVRPETTITAGPPALTAADTAQLVFSSPTTPRGAAIVFECADDGAAAYTPCTSPVTRTALASGTYSLRVRALWQGSVADDTPAELTWTVDRTPPETTISGGPSGDTGLGASSFTFTSEAGATFECSLDGAAYAACTSPHAVTVALGDHTFAVRASDALGNVDATPATRSYRGINTRAAPETTIDSAPPSPTNQTTAMITFSSPTPPGTDQLAFECAADGSTTFVACTSPVTRTGLADGDYSLRVRARWVGGAADETPAEATWTVDLTAPETTITAGPSGDTAIGAASFSFSSNDAGATFACRIDSAPFASCTSPHAISVTSGAHTFEVRATDSVGNVDASPAMRLYRGVASGGGTRLRLVAANLTSGNLQSYDPGHGGRILDGLDPDIVMIQEFNYFPGNTDTEIRAWVTATFGAGYFYSREAGAQIPNGVISKYPIVASGEWDDTAVSNRDFAWARIDIPGPIDLWVVSVHLLTRDAPTRNSEATQLVGYINQFVPTEAYLVIGGDFNTSSRTEPALSTFSSVVATGAPYPVDQAGDGDTNAGRSSPYDWVLLDPDLKPLQVPVVIGANSFANGLVVDTRVYSPIADLAPALSTDSGASMMQHMAVVVDVRLP